MSKEKLNTELIGEAKGRIDDLFSDWKDLSEHEINDAMELYTSATPAEQEVIDSYLMEKVRSWLERLKH